MHNLIEERAVKCIRCGFCLDACPTFRLTGNEADSPRGRIYLMRSVAENVIPLDQDVMKHIDACLGCRACETACPSGVQYASILEEFRSEIEERGMRPAIQRFARRQLLNTLTNPRLFAATLKASQVLGGSNGHQRLMPSFAAEMLTGSASVPITLPAVPNRVSIGTLPEVNPAIGERRATVAMLAGCVMRVLYHTTNEATVRVLQQNGCEVLVPRAAGCCGALHVHNGFIEDARQRARALLDALETVEMDAFIVNSAGCGSTLKEYGELLAEDPLYAKRAQQLAAKVKDISEFLMELGLRPPTVSLPVRVAYHDACHLAHGQKIAAAPRKMLLSIPKLQLIDLPESDTCCGSAGIYNLTQPVMAKMLQQRKVDFILESGAAVIATGNPGCLAWIQQGLKERGASIAVKHPIEILDEAYRA
jgi:glycolate oxidase iron-sulfur subunit